MSNELRVNASSEIGEGGTRVDERLRQMLDRFKAEVTVGTSADAMVKSSQFDAESTNL